MNSKVTRIFALVIGAIFLFGFTACDDGDSNNKVNHKPEWIAAPENMTVAAGVTYTFVLNGIAIDYDKPNSKRGDPGYLTCKLNKNTCSFDVNVTSVGGMNYVNCRMDFTPNDRESCAVTLAVKDGKGAKILEQIDVAVQSIDISNCAPNPVSEGNQVSCAVTSEDGAPMVDPTNDTCGGSINGAGPWTYDFDTTENDGPGDCTAAAQLAANDEIKDSELVVIEEVNEAPIIDLGCPSEVFEGTPINCSISVSDPDIPANDLNCSIAADDTCGGTLTGCSSYSLSSATAGCRASVDVTDDGDPVLFSNDAADVVVNPQQIGVFCPARANEGSAISCTVAITSGPSDCVIGPSDTCGGSIDSGCVGPYSASAQGESKGPGSCVVEVVKGPVSDSQRIIIDETNNAPVITAPSPITRLTREPFNQLYVHVTDADLPNTRVDDPGYLSCAKTAQTCSFDVSVSGTGQSSVDCRIEFMPTDTPETCTVTVGITDGYGTSVAQVVNVNVNQCIFYVDNTVGGTGGRSWGDAFTTVQEGIDAAWESCWVWVAEGTYSTGNSNPVAIMKDEVSLFGSFAGTETSLSQRYNIFTHPTYLDGANVTTHVVIASSDSELNGFQIIRGNADGGGEDDYGGGLYGAFTDNFTIENCVFKNNSATTGGGGVYLTYSFTSLIYNCLMHDNIAYYGPALYGYVVDNDVYFSTFAHNTGTSGGNLYYNYANNYLAYSIVTECENCWEMWGNCAKPPNYSSYYDEHYSHVWAWSFTGAGCKAGIMWEATYSRPWIFASGVYGDYYAAQPPGQASTSDFVDTTDISASSVGMNLYTTSTNGDPDTSFADLGFHYPIPPAP